MHCLLANIDHQTLAIIVEHEPHNAKCSEVQDMVVTFYLFVDIDQEMRRNSTNGARQEQNDLMTRFCRLIENSFEYI